MVSDPPGHVSVHRASAAKTLGISRKNPWEKMEGLRDRWRASRHWTCPISAALMSEERVREREAMYRERRKAGLARRQDH